MMMLRAVGRGSWLVAGLGLLALGCQETDDEAALSPAPDVGEQGPKPPEDPQADGSPLPYEAADTGGYTPPEFCPWAVAPDAVVLGELVDVRLTNSPAIVPFYDPDLERKDSWRYEEENCQSIDPAVVLEIEVHEFLRGEAPERLEVWVGASRPLAWGPMPYTQEDGTMVWPDGTGEGRRLWPGQIIGLPVHYLPEHELYSLMGEYMFGIDVDEKIIFQPGSYGQYGPTEAFGMTVPEIAEAASGCEPSDEAESRRNWMWQFHGPDGQRPSRYRTALCRPPDQEDGQEYDAGIPPADAG